MTQLSPAQRQALDLTRSLLVRAGAGSGKTTLLVARYLALFEREPELEPSRVLALTFTDKAAGEMAERIGERMALTPDAEISTIHAFCARVLRRHDPECGSSFELQDPGQRRQRLGEVLDRELLALEWQAPERIEPLAEYYSRPALLQLLTGLFDSPTRAAAWSGELLAAHDSAEACAADRVSRMGAAGALLATGIRQHPAWDALNRAIERELAREPADVLQRLRDALAASPILTRSGPAAMGRHLGELLGLIDRSRSGWRSRPELSARLGPVLSDFRELLLRCRPSRESEALERLAGHVAYHLAWLHDRCRRVYRESVVAAGLLDFDDLVPRTEGLLRARPEVARQLQDQYRYVLVDEFQDTDGEQWRAIRLVAGPEDQPVPQGKLFLVGDEKQSIYRFRGADVSVFNAARAGFDVVTLSENYRSRGALLAFLNRTFERVFAPEGSDWAPHEARPQSLTVGQEAQRAGGRVRLLVTPLGEPPPVEDLSAARALDSPDALEAGAVAALLREYAAAGRGWDELAVLLRTRAMLPSLRAAFEAADVPHVVWRGSGFYQSREVGDLAALMRCVLDPQDGVALAAVLRGPFVGISDPGLFELMRAGGLTAIDAAEFGGGARGERDARAARHAEALIGRLRRLSPLVPVSQWLREAIETSGAGIAFAERPDAEQVAANVEKFLGICRALDRGRGLPAVLEVVEGLVEGQHPEGMAAVALEGRPGVRVMTVHAAKGLQFPVVVLPGMARPARPGGGGRLRLEVLPELGVQVGLTLPADALLAQRLPEQGRPLLRHLLDLQAERLERAENKRLFYVACTRAEEELVFSAALREGEQGWESASSQGRDWEWWALISPQVEELELELACATQPVGARPVARAARCSSGPQPPRPTVGPAPVQTDLLARYEECPRRYYYAAVLGLPDDPPAEPPGQPVTFERDGVRFEGRLADVSEATLVELASDPRVAAILAGRFEASERPPCQSCSFSAGGVCDVQQTSR